MTKVRDPLDRYYTPPWCTRVLVDELWDRDPDLSPVGTSVLEPCCGMRDIADVLEDDYGCMVDTVDVDPNSRANLITDFIRMPTTEVETPEWVITNPPYSTEYYHAIDFVKKSFEHEPTKGIAHLLRMSMQEPCDNRVEFLKTYKPTYTFYLPRPRYKWNKTDSVTSIWMIWLRSGDSWAGVRDVEFFGNDVREDTPEEWITRYDEHYAPPQPTIFSLFELSEDA